MAMLSSVENRVRKKAYRRLSAEWDIWCMEMALLRQDGVFCTWVHDISPGMLLQDEAFFAIVLFVSSVRCVCCIRSSPRARLN